MKKRINVAGSGSESLEQRSLVSWWRLCGQKLQPGAVLYAIPNGGRRDAATGARLKAEGALAGIPDMMLAWPAGGKHGLYLELKKKVGGRASKAQNEVMKALESAGYACAVCHGWLEAKQAIEEYLLK